MAATNHERVGRAMDLLRAGLAPFVAREVTARVKAQTVRMDAIRRFAEDPAATRWRSSGPTLAAASPTSCQLSEVLATADADMVGSSDGLLPGFFAGLQPRIDAGP